MSLDAALGYAKRGWRVLPIHTINENGDCTCGKDCGPSKGKHPAVNRGVHAATTDIKQIKQWWREGGIVWNVGIATGSGLVVVDLDGQPEIEALKQAAVAHGGVPTTCVVRTGRGYHLYYSGNLPGSKKVSLGDVSVLCRGEGGYVVAPPSTHASGRRYEWISEVPLAPFPEWFTELATANQKSGAQSEPLRTSLGPIPEHLTIRESVAIAPKVVESLRPDWSAAEQDHIEQALAAIPASCGREPWLHVGMALHSLSWERPDGTDIGFDIWNRWSATCAEKYTLYACETAWRSFKRSGINIGTLFFTAREHGWDDAKEVVPEPPDLRGLRGLRDENESRINGEQVDLPPELAAKPGSPLVMLNNRFAVIGQHGGKCVVMEWVESRVSNYKIPAFQTFQHFSNRFCSQRIMVKGAKGEKQVKLGAYWLQWPHRTFYDGLDLIPGGEAVLPNGHLNLWDGWGAAPLKGGWPLMRQHILEVLAANDPASFEYIIRWAAWAVQHPGERAEVALVFQGGKGAGKGSFANVMVNLFGAHGLHVFHSKHMVGAFNAHLRNCLLLYADEAFWAGDKQGESTLKGMLTEPTMLIEQKGIDAIPWRNRLHVIMSANADWVIPATHDERRYAVFEVSNTFAENRAYFDALHKEMHNGGLGAMLHDLQHFDLNGWHPREVLKTEGLQKQKNESLGPSGQFWSDYLDEHQLQTIKFYKGPEPYVVSLDVLLVRAREDTQSRSLGRKTFVKFLREMGCLPATDGKTRGWSVPPLAQARAIWEKKYGKWKWSNAKTEWDVT